MAAQLHAAGGSRCAGQQASNSRGSTLSAPQQQRSMRALLHQQQRQAGRISSHVAANWKVWGPSADYSEGDADFYNTSNRLAKQFEWFAPREVDQPPPASPPLSPREEEVFRQAANQPEAGEFGLSPRQIAALGLSRPRSSMPDPVSWVAGRVVGERCIKHHGGMRTHGPAPYDGPIPVDYMWCSVYNVNLEYIFSFQLDSCGPCIHTVSAQAGECLLAVQTEVCFTDIGSYANRELHWCWMPND